jgi:hypothetical protein
MCGYRNEEDALRSLRTWSVNNNLKTRSLSSYLCVPLIVFESKSSRAVYFHVANNMED